MAVAELEKIVIDEGMLYPDFHGTTVDDFHTRLFASLQGREEIMGAELMVKSLEALAPENPGINTIGGHHGGAILPFYEFFTKSPLYEGYVFREYEHYEHTPHEQIAGHMVEGVSSMGIVGVAIATSGPGATNLITPFYDALMCSRPIVHITGNVATTVAGSMGFQEAPIIDMVTPVAKDKHYVTDTRDLPKIIYESFKTAASGRPGPVWIDVPKDIQLRVIKVAEIAPVIEQYYAPNGSLQNALDGLAELAQRIKTAKRIVLYVGGGAKDATEEIRQFAYRLETPVTTTLKGKGIFPETHTLSLGMLGMHGTAYANLAVDAADLIINVGARFDDRVTGNPQEFAKEAYIAHIDVDPRGIGPQKEANGFTPRQPHLTIQADAKKAMKVLNQLVDEAPDLSGWHTEIELLKREHPLDYDGRAELYKPKSRLEKIIGRAKALFPLSRFTKQDVIKPEYAIERIFVLTQGQYSISADVGQHQMWAAQYYKVTDPHDFDTSGGAGTMGYSVPAAYGKYKILRRLGKNKKVAVIVGDESFRMTPQALELYKREDADIKIFVIDNKSPDGTPGGMVRQWYKIVHRNTEHPVKNGSDIVSIARGYGIKAQDVRYISQVDSAIMKAINTEGPYLVRFRVDPYEDCLPMVPGGRTVKEMVTYQARQRVA